MWEFKDPRRLTSVATIALCAYMVLKVLASILAFVLPAGSASLAFAASVYLLALLACSILVGMWIYRTNANAHSFGGEMSITPGWSVGWFFIPFANLVMPYTAVHETWQVSHEFAGRLEEEQSSLVGWWWGLWIVNTIVSNFHGLLGGFAAGEAGGVAVVGVVATAVSIALCFVFIRLMRRLVSAQRAAAQGSVFA